MKKYVLTEDYQLVSDGVCMIQIKGGIARIYIGEEKPNKDTDVYFSISENFAYTGDEKVWARYSYDPIDTDIIAIVDTPVHPPYWE